MTTNTPTNASDDAAYKCGNCRSFIAENDVKSTNYGNPMCPNCNVETLTEMDTANCPDCENASFKIIQRAVGESITGAEPSAICRECGRTGEVDDDGIWW